MNAPFGEDYEADPQDRLECSECGRPIGFDRMASKTCADCDPQDAIDATDWDLEFGGEQ